MPFAKDNSYLVIYVPPSNKAFVFWVVSVLNQAYDYFEYGPIPIPQGASVSLYSGGALSVPYNGVLPPMSYTGSIPIPPLSSITASLPTGTLPTTYDRTDMFYYPSSNRNWLFHWVMKAQPSWLRVEIDIPIGTTEYYLYNSPINVGYAMGWRRGSIEFIVFPDVHYGFRFGNDMPFGVMTGLFFKWAWYKVYVPNDPTIIYNAINHKMPNTVYWTIPLAPSGIPSELERAWLDTYGFDGFPIIEEQAKAISEYQQILNSIRSRPGVVAP